MDKTFCVTPMMREYSKCMCMSQERRWHRLKRELLHVVWVIKGLLCVGCLRERERERDIVVLVTLACSVISHQLFDLIKMLLLICFVLSFS